MTNKSKNRQPITERAPQPDQEGGDVGNWNSSNRRALAEYALAAARRGDFGRVEKLLRYLTNPHDGMQRAAAACAREGDFEFLINELRYRGQDQARQGCAKES